MTWKIIWGFVIFLYMCIILAHCVGVAKAEDALPAVYMSQIQIPTFSIYAHDGKLLFDGVYDIRAFTYAGISFIHNGKRKVVMGNIWIEPEPPHGSKRPVK